MTSPEILMFIEFFFEFLQGLYMIQALYGRGFGIDIKAWLNGEGGYRQREHVLWKIGVKNEKCLTRNPKRQFHARKDDQPLSWRDGLTIVGSFVIGGAPNVPYKGHVMMVGNSDGLNALLPAGPNEATCICVPGLVSNAIRPFPTGVSWRVHLKIAAIEVRASIHFQAPAVASKDILEQIASRSQLLFSLRAPTGGHDLKG